MRQLMISLDKKILDITSAAAQRMVEYGKNNELYIVIPHAQKLEQNLSSSVRVYGSGGSSKVCQFFKTCKTARGLVPKFKIDSVTTQDPFFTGLLGLRVSHKFKISLEVQVHGDFFEGDFYRANIFGKIKIFIAKFVLRYADSIRTVGERVKQSLLKIGIEEEKIRIKPITLNVDSTMTTGIVQGKKGFVWAGRMEPEKNLIFLVDIFSKVVQRKPSSQLILIGEGSEKELLQQKVKKLNIENNIMFVPWLPSPIDYIKNAQALLLPSLTESYGAVAMEANRVGTPIIMNDVGVANYELKPSDKVRILPVNNRDKWIEAILSI